MMVPRHSFLADADKIASHNATPLARIVSYGFGGVPARVMGMGPVPASQMALERAGLTVNDLAVVESNEAFAAQACAVSSSLGLMHRSSTQMVGRLHLAIRLVHRRNYHDQTGL
ncbi:MAG: hypothetical protein CM15mP95_3010 [Alphaproteobacteria bacterium]|nr:MAG: hypothetical protein CM15mP95_3010 [Alphaproteobacteria bacterium]